MGCSCVNENAFSPGLFLSAHLPHNPRAQMRVFKCYLGNVTLTLDFVVGILLLSAVSQEIICFSLWHE